MKLAILGIDLAKSVFHLHGADAHGHAMLRKRLSRSQLPAFLANLPRCTVRWRLVAAPITGRVRLPTLVMPCG